MELSPKAVAYYGQDYARGLAHRCARKYAALIGPLRETAKAFGYCLAVHGSLKRDIDLVAVPWVDTAGRPLDLVEALRAKAQAVNGVAFIQPEKSERKPHGRLAWSIHLGNGPYLDLSVIPPGPCPAAAVSRPTV